MSDEDGDGTWSITMSIPVGTTSNYTFLNGNCGDWSCKEDLTPGLRRPQQLQRPHHRGRRRHDREHLLRRVHRRRFLPRVLPCSTT